MKKLLLPWCLALLAGAAAMAARYLLIQPPELAHQCDAGPGPWWCGLRLAIIYTYAWWGLGYASLGLSVLALLMRRVWIASLTLAVAFAAIVLYCYEPGAVGMAVGALVLARAQVNARSGLPAQASAA